MSVIRMMQAQDIDQVSQVEAAGFGAWWKKFKGDVSVLPRRTRANLLSCLEKDPQGSFVAEADDQVVGFIFSRSWGRVGWFGTFAVLPEYQGGGIGKGLIAASLDYLGSAHLSLIGLETMPEVPYNLGLYLGRGFLPRYPTLFLTRRLAGSNAEPSGLLPWSSAGLETRQHWLADLKDAAGSLPPGFDYSKEILTTQQYSLGETLILIDGEQAVGMSVILLASQREAGDNDAANAYVMALHPAHTHAEAFNALVSGSEAFALAHGKQNFAVSVNARHTWALQHLLRRGYRVERAMVRMVLADMSESPQDQDLVNLNRWAG